jgi:nicotinamide riboside kinase
MNFQEILFSVLGIIITGLASWGTTVLVKWLNSKIKDKELATFAATIITVVNNAVKATYQAYVQSLKGTDAWTKAAQKEALEQALRTAKSELTTEAIAYIEQQHGDVDKYIKTLIESVLYDLKNGNKKVTVTTEQITTENK